MLQQSMDQKIVPMQPQLTHQLSYREMLMKWNPYSMKNLALCYEFRTEKEPKALELVPDACLDFLFRLDGRSATPIVLGIQTTPFSLDLEPEAVYFGFKPYTTKGLRRCPTAWPELNNSYMDLREQVNCDQLLEEMLVAASFEARVDIMRRFALKSLADECYAPDFVEYSEMRLCSARGNVRVEDIADFTGYSGRYCREKFKEANGISIKRYSNIIRFQNALRMLAGEKAGDLSDIVFENGYFDQPHLSREFKLYAGDSPLHYRQKVLQAADF